MKTKKRIIEILQNKEHELWDLTFSSKKEYIKAIKENKSIRLIENYKNKHKRFSLKWCITYNLLKEIGIKPLD